MSDAARDFSPDESVTGSNVLRVSEIFESLQGEGINTGRPSTFLRLALCNLRCAWCDTKYTWDWATYNYKEEVELLTDSDVVTAVKNRSSKNLVITGGEPLLQQARLIRVIEALKETHTYEIETAGTIAPSRELIELIHVWNVSPKLANSGNALNVRFRPDALAVFASLANATFKFVIQSDDDLEEVLGLVTRLSIPSERVFLMPQATDLTTMTQRCLDLAPICLKYQFRLSYRLHVALWGNRRGV